MGADDMKNNRLIICIFLIILTLFSIGCANNQYKPTTPTGKIYHDQTTTDSDRLETKIVEETVESDESDVEPSEEDVVDAAKTEEIEKFAKIFADTWNRKSYTALYNLFAKNYRAKISSKEFNFLARRFDAKLGLEEVSLKAVSSGYTVYELKLFDDTVLVEADIDEENDLFKHDTFYFFKNMDVDFACENDSNCFMTFAVISGNKNYCEKAGDLKLDCMANFGVSKGITEKIDECISIKEYYGRAECLTRIAVKENSIEPCWDAGYDKHVFECMGKVAAARSDVDECNEFVSSRGPAGTRLQKAYCIVSYVRETSDSTKCSLIDRRDDVVLGAMQENCYK